jgi:hypothetical protein
MDGDREALAQNGISLRDYFAGQALAGICANAIFHAYVRGFFVSLNYEAAPGFVSGSGHATLAMEAFRAADAMLAERVKGGAA